MAKEHTDSVVSFTSDEEPKHRGDIDQHPILLPVHEHNPERRFVLVPGATEGDASNIEQARYEANTCRKYVIVDGESGESSKEDRKRKDAPKERPVRSGDIPEPTKDRRDIPKRKSHQDLPRLSTDFEETEPSIRRSGSRRDRERPLVHQEPQDSQGSRERSSAKPPDSAFLSPAAVKLTAGKRDRAYSDARSDTSGRPSRSPSTRRDADIEVSDRKKPHHSSRYSESSTFHQRTSSTTNRPLPFIQPSGGDPDDIFAFMAPDDSFMAKKRDTTPPRRARNSKSPPHPRGAREMPGSSPTRKRHPRPATQDREGYSSDDSYKGRRTNRGERSYPTRTKPEADRPSSASPSQPRRSNQRLGGPIPPLTAGVAAHFLDDPPRPGSRSATFPADKPKRSTDRSVSPSPATSASPSRRPVGSKSGAQPGRHSRDASVGSVSNGSASFSSSLPGSLPRASTLEKPLPGPVAALTKQESSEPQSPALYWQPSQSSEQGEADEDVTSRALARLPDCRWKHPALARHRAGSEQLLTLKRAENFTICPDCYGALFSKTQFQHLFVPAPLRSGDQVVSCDFGASPWYRIAYLMTVKQELPDLRLLQGIASVAARSQACAGAQLASRIWYSVIAPGSRRPVQSFNACLTCAKMVEALLPNLAGVFVPLDSHEATRGVCDLHFALERRRFFDYFDEMKATSARALSHRTAPNLMELVDRVRDISLHEECLRNTPIPNRKWHILEQVPEFTVCEECFTAVVWPMIEDEDNDTEIPRNFFKHRQPKPVAACQLYSERMRRVFREACKFDDFAFLTSCVRNRLKTLAEVKARYNELQREDQEDPRVQDDLAALARLFKEVE